MGDIVGRLFREFAVTLAVTILISAVVSLTLTPMLSARWLKDPKDEKPSRVAHHAAAAFTWVERRYERGLDFVLARRFATLMVAIAHAGADRPALHYHPQGPVPDAGYRPAPGADGRAAGHFLRAHGDLQSEAARRDPRGPGRRLPLLLRRRRRVQQCLAQHRHDADQPEDASRQAGRDHEPAEALGRPDPRPRALSPADPGPDHRRRERADPISLLGPGLEYRRRHRGIAADRRRAAACRARSRNVSTDAGAMGSAAYINIDRDTAARLNVTASIGRRHALFRLRPAHRLDHLHRDDAISRHP